MSAAFDLDRALRDYLVTFANKRLVGREAFDELESHLRDEIDDLVTSGLASEEAFRRAVQTFGGQEVLGEFDKLYGRRRFAQLANVLSFYFDRRVVMRLVVGLGFGVMFMLLGLMLEGGHIASMINTTGFMIVVGGAIGALIVAYPLRVLKTTAVLVFTGRQSVRAAYLDAAKVCRSFGDLAILASFVSLLFGTVHVLENLQYPEMIGPGVAVAIVSILYGLLIKLFVGNALHASFMAKAYPSTEAVVRSSGDDLTAA